MKKILSLALLLSFLICNAGFCKEAIISNEETGKNAVPTENEAPETAAENLKNISTSTKELSKKEYKRGTVFKHYSPVEVTFKNTNSLPVLLTADTEVEFLNADDSIVKSASRRTIYMNSRKKDRGRHYALQVPGVILGTAVSVGTFLLGTPIGYGIYKAMQYPTVKAARTNVNISQDLYSTHCLPLRLEPNVQYSVYFYPQKNTEIKVLRVKNVSYDNKIYNMEIPVDLTSVEEEL